ncbi:MAG: lysyl oxidase family protein [bacterium]|nr:lysyl oxidase family protein [bacterium]
MKRRFVLLVALVGALFFFSYYSLTTPNPSILDSRVITVINKKSLPAAVFNSFNKLAVAEPEKVRDDELLPDLVPLPARDLTVKKEKGEEGKPEKTLLLFSTTYYNQGTGPVELRADPNTKGIRKDIEREVFQRVYLKDGKKYEDLTVGIFMWHQEHLHYHFADFVEYDLEAVDAPYREELEGSRIKSTFCLRDVSKVDLELANRDKEPRYKICGKEIQGVSVGWGDTYYYDYPAQSLNISDLASGTYRFTQTVNPERKLKESNYGNNVSSVLFRLDAEKGKVEVLEETPASNPAVEHIHLEDPFGQ